MKPKIILTPEEYNAKMQAFLIAGEKTGFQKACDFISIKLNDPDIMGSRALSGDKIDEVISAAIRMSDEYHQAFAPIQNVEGDVWQERLDAHQKRIFKEKFDPFEKRYPYVRKVRYDGKKSSLNGKQGK